MRYAIYDASGDRRAMPIISIEAGRLDDIAATVEPGQGACMCGGGVADDTHYIDRETFEPVAIPATPITVDADTVAADGSSLITCADLAIGTSMKINGPQNGYFVAEADREQLTFARPGQYEIVATGPWPHRSTTVVIHAT